jgi:hypothetical protein
MYQPKYAIEASATMSSYEVTGLVVSAVTSAVTSGRDLAEESIAWATESQQDLTVILIDFEKAFDWVNWTFLQEVMRKMSYDHCFFFG